MPFIVKKYNVSLENMGICGASCGGLASLYVGLANIEKYDFIFTFSSALGILDNNLLNEFLSVFNLSSKECYPLIFSYCGNNDPLEKLLFKGDILLKNALISQGYPDSKIYEYYEESALHNEDSWRYAFNFGLTLIK
jgi:predicted alpha/beta superfamily hydrolase